MSYLALYRKYRPKTFDEVVDQDHITKTLTNQIASDKIGHAYLFCGSRGTGKTTTAKIFARSINCEKPEKGKACGKCANCLGKAEQNLDILEIDAASNNGVDEIRELRESVKYPPVNSKYKVFIIDEVHMLSTSAFNALLKTLEEPPKYVVFILATTEVHKLPATILSRCMRFDFKLVSTDKIASLLKNIFDDSKIKYDEKAVQLIARAGEGSVRDALSIADMVISYSNDNLTYESVVKVIGSIEKEQLYEIAQGILAKNMGKVLAELDKLLCEGKPPLVLSKDLISYLRDLLVIMTIPEKAKEMVVVPKDVFEKMQAQSVKENYSVIVRAIEELSMVEQELRYSVQPKIVLETSVIKAMNAITLEERIEALEKKLQAPLEDKKKISQILSRPQVAKTITAQTVYGELLKQLRENSEMLIYSAVSDTESINLSNGEFVLTLTENAISKSLEDVRNKQVLEKIFAKMNLRLRLELIEDESEQLVKKLKEIIGSKLKIKED